MECYTSDRGVVAGGHQEAPGGWGVVARQAGDLCFEALKTEIHAKQALILEKKAADDRHIGSRLDTTDIQHLSNDLEPHLSRTLEITRDEDVATV